MLLLGVGDAAERRAEVDADPLRVARAPSLPGVSPASSSASRPATSPNWLNRSSWRAVLGGIQASGSKSSTWAATCERNGLGSNRSMRLTGERPARRPARNASRPVPIAVIDADPGDPDAAPIAHVGSGSSGARRLGVRDVRRRERLGERLERGQRPAGDRPREEPVDERARSGATRGRKSWSIETRDAAGGRLDPPGHVHPLRRPGDVDEAQAARRAARSRSAPAR